MLMMKESESERRRQETQKGIIAWSLVLGGFVGLMAWDCSGPPEEPPKEQEVEVTEPCDCKDQVQNLQQEVSVLQAKLHKTVADFDACMVREVEYVLKVKK